MARASEASNGTAGSTAEPGLPDNTAALVLAHHAEQVDAADAIADDHKRQEIKRQVAEIIERMRAGTLSLPPHTKADNAFVGFEHFDGAAFGRLEAAGGIVLPDQMRLYLDRIVRKYGTLGKYRSLIDPEQLAILTDLVTHGSAYAHALERARANPMLAALVVIDRSMLMDDEARHHALRTIDDYSKVVRKFTDHAAQELRSLEQRTKSRADLPTMWLVAHVGAMFAELGGKPVISEGSKGPFARFLAALWPHLPETHRPKSDAGLIEAARQFRKKARVEQRQG